MKLNYKTIGEGSPIIILHGLFGCYDNWFSIAKVLAETNQVVLVDQRNHGGSPNAEEHTYETMAADLEELMDDLKLTSSIILGHSMGGKTAMRFATENPNRVDKLIVVDISPKYYPPHHSSILAGLNSIDTSAIKSRGEADKQMAEHVSSMGVRQFLLKNLSREGDKYEWKVNLPVLTDQINNVGEALPSGGLFEGETLFISGATSDYIIQEEYDIIDTFFPNSTVVEIPDAGHWVHAENPKAFLEQILNFI